MDLRELTYAYYVRSLVQKCLPPDWENLRILEIGAGLDNYSSVVKRSRYVALDIDLGPARDRYTFVCGDVRALPFRENAFDCFIASNILEHVAEPVNVLKDLRRICSKQGLVIVPVWGDFPLIYDPINWLRRRRGRTPHNFGIGGFGHCSLLTEEKWEELFLSSDFMIIQKAPFLQDVWACLEFFIYSIFLSRREYVSLARGQYNSPFLRLMKIFLSHARKIMRIPYYMLRNMAWYPRGYIGQSYLLGVKD